MKRRPNIAAFPAERRGPPLIRKPELEAKQKAAATGPQRRNKASAAAEKSSPRRDEILRVAAALFAEHGYEETTIRQIGDAAGILSGSLYHHFQTKEEMLHELLKGFTRMVGEYQAIVDQGRSAKETVRAMIELGLRTVVSNPNIVAITVHERKYLARHPSFAYLETVWHDISQVWCGVLERGVAEGAIRNDVDLHLMLRMINDLVSAAVDWYRLGGRYSIEKIIDTQTAIIFGGIAR
jgi:AcrR family transcriptional regulator